jgi:hypothetical protein
MKQVIIIVVCLFLNTAFGQKDSVFHISGKESTLFPFEMKHYKVYLDYNLVKNVKVIPYYARFTRYRYKDVYSAYLNTKLPDVDTLFMETQEQLDCLYEYASPHQLIYADGFLDIPKSYFEMEASRKTLPPVNRLHCSKIINSKNEEVFIYYTSTTGPDSIMRFNPQLTFDAIEHPDFTVPMEYVTSNKTRVADYDLEKGTYFFNWTDQSDSLVNSLHTLWNLAAKRNALDDSIHFQVDSLMKLFRTTKNHDYRLKAEALYLHYDPIFEEFERKKNNEFKKIIQWGYGNMNHYNESKRIEFEIRKEAFLSHKISNKAISPEHLNEYLNGKKKKSNSKKAVKQLLGVLQIKL